MQSVCEGHRNSQRFGGDDAVGLLHCLEAGEISRCVASSIGSFLEWCYNIMEYAITSVAMALSRGRGVLRDEYVVGSGALCGVESFRKFRDQSEGCIVVC